MRRSPWPRQSFGAYTFNLTPYLSQGVPPLLFDPCLPIDLPTPMCSL